MRIYLLCLLLFLTGCQTTSSTRPCKLFEVPKYVAQQLMADLSTLASPQANGQKPEHQVINIAINTLLNVLRILAYNHGTAAIRSGFYILN